MTFIKKSIVFVFKEARGMRNAPQNMTIQFALLFKCVLFQLYINRHCIAPFLSGLPNFIKWKTFPRYWPFVRGIHRSPVNSPHKGQWRGALILSLIYVWINSWVNNSKAGDSRRYRVHYDVSVMWIQFLIHVLIPLLVSLMSINKGAPRAMSDHLFRQWLSVSLVGLLIKQTLMNQLPWAVVHIKLSIKQNHTKI